MLDEKSAKFYESLRQKELEKDQLLKQQKALEQRRLEQLKQQQKELTKKKSLGINKPSKTIKILKKPKSTTDSIAAISTTQQPEKEEKPNVSSIISGYSSSEDYSDKNT